MTISENVVRDLLPVYLAGEASADTVALVEDYLARNPGMRTVLKDAGGPAMHDVAMPVNLERRSVERTRQLLSRRNCLLGAAVFLTMLPFSFVVGDEGVTFVLYRDAPREALGLFLLGVMAWVGFLLTLRRLGATGLQARRSWAVRLGWAFAGFLIGAAGVLIAEQLGAREWEYWRVLRSCLLGAVGMFALWLGEKLNRVPTLEDLHRPTTLFGK